MAPKAQVELGSNGSRRFALFAPASDEFIRRPP